MNSFNGTKNFSAAIFLSAIFILFAGGSAAAQIVFDSASTAAAFNNTGVTSLTWQHTVTSGGTNKALFVGISTTTAPLLTGAPICSTMPLLCTGSPLSGINSTRVISVTYDGVIMQQVGFQVSTDMAQAVEIFRLVAPSSGTHDIAVTFNPSLVFQVLGGSTSYTGVSQTTPTGAFTSTFGSNNTPTVSVTDAVSGDLILDAIAVPPSANFAVEGADQTLRYNGRSFFNNSYDLGAGSTEPGTSAVETMSWTLTNSTNWAIAAVAIKPSMPTAAGVNVGGQIKATNEEPLANVSIALQNLESGEIFYATSDENGFYEFADLEPTKLYRVEVFSRFYDFSPNSQTVNLNESLAGINFYGSPRKRINKFTRQGVIR